MPHKEVAPLGAHELRNGWRTVRSDFVKEYLEVVPRGRVTFFPEGRRWIPYDLKPHEYEVISSEKNRLDRLMERASRDRIEALLKPLAMQMHIKGRISSGDDAKALARITAQEIAERGFPLIAVEEALYVHRQRSPHWPELSDLYETAHRREAQIRMLRERAEALIVQHKEKLNGHTGDSENVDAE